MIIGQGTNAVKTKSNVFLAPLAGVTDHAFRLLCNEFGCGLCVSEMISAKGLVYNSKNTFGLLQTSDLERPVGAQLFGACPETFAEAVKLIEHLPFDFIDVNMGCPVPKIFKNGEGSALMGDPRLVFNIVAAMAKATNKPITVKIRKGIDEEHSNAVEVARAIEAAGGAMVSVHGRTRTQYYSGAADWNIIADVKRAVSIPVVGNGDVNTPIDAENMFKQTNCDGVMIGRAAMGNPWIFAQINHYLLTGETLPPPTAIEKIAVATRHAKMLVEQKGEYTGVREMRHHISWYTKGLTGASALRGKINQLETLEEMLELFALNQL